MRVFQASYVGASSWLSYWTAANDEAQKSDNATSEVSTALGLGVYGAFGVGQGQ